MEDPLLAALAKARGTAAGLLRSEQWYSFVSQELKQLPDWMTYKAARDAASEASPTSPADAPDGAIRGSMPPLLSVLVNVERGELKEGRYEEILLQLNRGVHPTPPFQGGLDRLYQLFDGGPPKKRIGVTAVSAASPAAVARDG
jgi:hypothetical protein